MVCDPVEVTDQCLLTIRRAFNEPGTYCVNITLGDDTSQALTSALISVNGGESKWNRCLRSVNSFSSRLFHKEVGGVCIYYCLHYGSAERPQLRLGPIVGETVQRQSKR